MLEKFS